MTLKISVQDLSVGALRTYSQQIIDVIRDDAFIADRLATRGWTAEKTEALQQLHDTFDDAAQRFDALKGQKDAAAESFAQDVEAFRRGPFKQHVGLVDAVFLDDRAVRSTLGLDDGLGNLNTEFREWAARAADFYDRLRNDDFTDALDEIHLTRDELDAGAAKVERLRQLHQSRATLDADRQQARRERDAHRQALEIEIRRVQQFALVVLDGHGDVLEKVGYDVSSDADSSLPAEA